ncbi:unnamed protein product [Medioppia subpectinata]|uniref:RNA 2-O ribose methyltransferase substrate binding domain-containing protein n=1 Tax=Medioppia subpectinata TaxID=1979941 RepID=A0A7R9KCG3_9ACAR|nr:unnamed protein product [Medioppia subpectinata]CAG2100937.1 unnamed protein product [Medioppia subpectinata]
MFQFMRSTSLSSVAKTMAKMSGQSTSSATITTSTVRPKRQVFSRRPVKVLTESGKDYFKHMEETLSSATHEYRPNRITDPKERKTYNKYYDEGFTEDYLTADAEDMDDTHRPPMSANKPKRPSLKTKPKCGEKFTNNETNEEVFDRKTDGKKSHAKKNMGHKEEILTPRIPGIPVYQKLCDNNMEFIKLISDMKIKNRRENQNVMLLEGKRLISDAIRAGLPLKTIYFSKEENLVGIQALDELVLKGLQLKKVLYRDIKLFSEMTTSPGVLAVTERPSNDRVLVNQSVNGQQLPLILIGDNIRDPGNMGTMLRCAAAVGAMSVVLTRGCTDVWSPKVLRSGAGAHFRIPIVNDIEWPLVFNYIPIDKPFDLYIAESKADDYSHMSSLSGDKDSKSAVDLPLHTINTITKDYSQSSEVTVLRDDSYDTHNEELVHYRNRAIAFTNYCDTKFYTSGIDRPAVLVIGGETHGLSDQSYKLAYDYIGRRIRIPLSAGVDSLNSAVAAATMSGEKQFALLSNVLSDVAIRDLSVDMKTKLETHLKASQSAAEESRREWTAKSSAAEQKIFSTDREVQNLRSKLQMSEGFADDLKRQLREAEELLQKARHDGFEALEGKRSVSFELNSVKEKMDRFSTEKLNLSEMLNRRQEEINHLQNELKTMALRLMANSEGRVETSIRAEELELKYISVQHQEKRMSQERDLYQKQIQALNDELNVKLNELLAIRRERAVQTFELQSSLEQKTDENVKYLDEIKLLKQMIEKKDKHIDSLSVRIGEIQHMSAQLEEDFHNETSAQNNLIELHKGSNEELKKRNESLITNIEEMQKMLQTAKEAHSELEDAFLESQRRSQQELHESAQQSRQLAAEIETLKESATASRENMELAFQRQYPLAANTRKLLDKNMSFTQIFEEMVSAKQELDDEKKENAVLKEHLQQLAAEAEENAPLLYRKIQEHQRAAQTVNDLQTQLSSVMTEREQWLKEKDSIIRINKQFEREIQRYENDNQNLSKQVRTLIKSVQEARGFTVSRDQNQSISSTVGDIPQELVTFRDIEELQTRNQELMNALRETNDKLLELGEEQKDSESEALKRDLEAAFTQLQSLRAERLQQTELMETLIRQRDLYHQMVASHSADEQNLSQRSFTGLMSSPNTSRNNATNEDIQELKTDLNRSKHEYEEYRKESSSCVKALQESYDRVRTELSAVKIELAKTSTELTFTIERNDMFKTNCEQFQMENATLKERNTILNENVKKHEQSVVLLRQETSAAAERLNRLELTAATLRSERDMHLNNEQKLIHENELMMKTVENQNKMINTLQTVQNNMKQIESDSIDHLKSQNAKLENECLYLRNKCDKECEKYSEASALWEKTAQELQHRIETEVDKYMRIHEELAVYQTKTQSLQQTVTKIEGKEAEIVSLREELKHWQIRANNLIEQLNKISPEGLKRLNEEKKSQGQISNLVKEINQLKQQVESHKNDKKTLETQIQTITRESEAKLAEARKVSDELTAVRTENGNNQNTITQLRKVARKYKMQFDEQKVQFDQLKHDYETAVKSAVDQQSAQNAAISEQQTTELSQKIVELNTKIKEMEQQMDKLTVDLTQAAAEREVARGQATEKEEKAKKIALQARQRLTAISNEKNGIVGERDSLRKSTEELKERIRQLEQNNEENNLRLASIKSQFDAKVKRHERELTEALKLVETLKASQQQSQQQLQPTAATIAVTSASVQTTSQTAANPVRHSVHPQSATVQPLSAKSTPTASIRPLAVTPTMRTGRNVSARMAAVATVQPTTDDQSQHIAVPQATVQPTQAVSSQMTFTIPSTTSVESETITSHIEEAIEEPMIEPMIEQPLEGLAPIEVPVIPAPIETEESIAEQQTVSCTEESVASEPLVTPETEQSLSQTSETVSETSATRILREKILLKRTRTDETSAAMSPKKARTETQEEAIPQPEEEVETIVASHEMSEPTVSHTEEKVVTYVAEEDDDVIILESDESEEEDNVEQKEESNDGEDDADDEEDDEEEDEEEYDEEEENEDNDNVGESEVYPDEEEEDYNEEEEEEGEDSHYEEEGNEEHSEAGSEGEGQDIEVVGVSDNVPEPNEPNETEEVPQQSLMNETIGSETIEQSVVSTTMASISVPSVVTSSTETNPFLRPFGGTSAAGRQSFYIPQNQQSSTYDEGDGIVPSTPTLFVPRRGDGFADALNSPRVPQGRFVFSSSIPEAATLSGLANETTLGVDDTRMDLSQFDDNNNGRSVPNTPLANSPAVDTSIHSTVQNVDLDTDADVNYEIEATASETIVPVDLESDLSAVDDSESQSATNPMTESIIDTNVTESSDVNESVRQSVSISESQTSADSERDDESAEKSDEIQVMYESESIPTSSTSSAPSTSTSTAQRGVPTARRGRGFSGPPRGTLQRRPIMPPTPPSTAAEIQPSFTAPNPSQPPLQQQQPQQQQQQPPPQTGRTIRLRDSKFSTTTRGNFRGRPSRGGPRGGRGGYHYNN